MHLTIAVLYNLADFKKCVSRLTQPSHQRTHDALTYAGQECDEASKEDTEGEAGRRTAQETPPPRSSLCETEVLSGARARACAPR